MYVLKILLFIVEACIGLGGILLTSLFALNIVFCLNSSRAAIILCVAWLVNIVLMFVTFYFSLSLSWMALLHPAYVVIAIGLFAIALFHES